MAAALYMSVLHSTAQRACCDRAPPVGASVCVSSRHADTDVVRFPRRVCAGVCASVCESLLSTAAAKPASAAACFATLWCCVHIWLTSVACLLLCRVCGRETDAAASGFPIEAD